VTGVSIAAVFRYVWADAPDVAHVGEIFEAHKLFEFETVIAETYGDVLGASYYAVAVVNTEDCGSMLTSFSDLEGKR